MSEVGLLKGGVYVDIELLCTVYGKLVISAAPRKPPELWGGGRGTLT